jgi:hypothetical protein
LSIVRKVPNDMNVALTGRRRKRWRSRAG